MIGSAEAEAGQCSIEYAFGGSTHLVLLCGLAINGLEGSMLGIDEIEATGERSPPNCRHRLADLHGAALGQRLH